MKKLIIVAHPDIQESVINKRWVEELKKDPEQFAVHNIYNSYPDWNIDVEKEQKLIEEYNTILFQYPMYWFNCPPLLKKYMDDVFTHGWAYGSKGDKLKGKKFAIAISTGIETEEFQLGGKYHVTLDQLLQPFKTMAQFCRMEYKGHFTLDDSHNVTPDRLEKSAQKYVKFIQAI